MKSDSWRVQLGFIAFGYAAVIAVAAGLFYERHLQELRHPAEVVASSGMYAGGDLLLEIFIAFLFMVPTIFLLLFIVKFEAFYTAYSRFLLGLSLSAPICGSVFFFGGHHVSEGISVLCLYRLFLSPFILAGIGVSRLVARFDRAKRLNSYAFLIEGLTLGTVVALAVSLRK